MAKGHIQQGKLYRIIGSAKGPSGSSVGRKCIAVHPISGEPHTLWGICWMVETADGIPFDYKREACPGFPEVTGMSMQIACAQDWLEEIDEDPPEVLEKERIQELTD